MVASVQYSKITIRNIKAYGNFPSIFYVMNNFNLFLLSKRLCLTLYEQNHPIDHFECWRNVSKNVFCLMKTLELKNSLSK